MNNKPLLIKNAWLCQIDSGTVNPFFGNMLIENGIITQINSADVSIQQKDFDIIDAQGRVVTIPNVNFHDHIYSRLAKGLPSLGSMQNFTEILENLWWKLDQILDFAMIKASAYMAAVESIRYGVTYIFDHHSSPLHTIGSLKILKDALSEFSIRNVLCFETTDRNGEQLKLEGIKENQEFFLHNTDENSESVFGLHASFTVEDSTLSAVRNFLEKNKIGIHIHLCEDESDRSMSLQKYGKLPVQRLLDFNLLNDKSILVHGVHLTKEEFDSIKSIKPALAVNLDSNLNNAVGTPKFENIPEEIPILCGTDGMHANIPRSQKQMFLIMRNQKLSFDKAFYLFRKMYFDQLNFIKKYFPDFLSLQVGNRADLIIWDYVPPTPMNQNNFFGHYVYGILERQVHSVIQNGKVLMNNFNLTDVDETKFNNYIYEQGKRLAKGLTQPFPKGRA
ncbi:MAG: amidohydrolase family protein [Ignavibacteriaceae bacterium]|nr:amidohydrolase family protein [Ignavibacteriaceae bacterium]